MDGNLINYWVKMLNENKYVGEAGMSIDDILKKHQEKTPEQAEQKPDGSQITKITITSISPEDYSIEYTIEREDGSKTEEKSPGVDTGDEYYRKMLNTLRKMGDGKKTPDEYDVAVAMLRAPFDAHSKKPIKWEYCNVGDENNPSDIDKDWCFRPSEDYFGWKPAEIDAMVDAGWRHPMVTG